MDQDEWISRYRQGEWPTGTILICIKDDVGIRAGRPYILSKRGYEEYKMYKPPSLHMRRVDNPLFNTVKVSDLDGENNTWTYVRHLRPLKHIEKTCDMCTSQCRRDTICSFWKPPRELEATLEVLESDE